MTHPTFSLGPGRTDPRRELSTMSDSNPSFEAVMTADTAFHQATSAIEFDPKKEATALSACFESPDVAAACLEVNQCRWQECRDAWQMLKIRDESIGADIKAVVSDLDAPHLRPTSILQRIQGGVKPACHGLFTLVDYLRAGTNSNPPNPSPPQ
jgi:hypothetical protein